MVEEENHRLTQIISRITQIKLEENQCVNQWYLWLKKGNHRFARIVSQIAQIRLKEYILLNVRLSVVKINKTTDYADYSD